MGDEGVILGHQLRGAVVITGALSFTSVTWTNSVWVSDSVPSDTLTSTV